MLIAAAAAGVVLILLVGWLASRRSNTTPAAGQRNAVHGRQDPGMAHVHGLGVDPSDGMLYAATHYGLFSVPETGAPTRIADRRQDTMGFTIAGPNLFLGSGHPDPVDKLPSRLGLIQSTDAGKTWQQLSLAGKADFHALKAAHGSVYGYDGSGGFMVSADKLTWETRSKLPMRDFAVSPSDADMILATTEDGLQLSTDGGRHFTQVAGAPALMVLGWDRGSSVYGVAPGGEVYRSGDAGSSWQQGTSLEGQPEAFLVSGERLLAATGTGIFESTDGARSWRLRFRQEH